MEAAEGLVVIRSPQKTKAQPPCWEAGLCCKRLAMTYSRMGRPHTTIGDDAFHF